MDDPARWGHLVKYLDAFEDKMLSLRRTAKVRFFFSFVGAEERWRYMHSDVRLLVL